MIMQKIREFMYGRNGFDQLSFALFVCGFVFHMFFNLSRFPLFYLISLAFDGIAIFRILSKDIGKRRIENQKFMSFWYKMKNKWVGLRADIEERKTYKHFRCPKCGQKIRIPKGRGKVEIRCPKCSEKFVKKA